MQSLFWIELTLCLIYKGFLVSIFWNIYKDFEPSWDTTRLKFKKPSDKPSKKKTAAAGVKRIAINANMRILFGKDGIIKKVHQNVKKLKKLIVNSMWLKQNITNQIWNKRDLKDLEKNSTEVMKPIARNTSIKSDLSVHVVTRWYRSSEIYC